MVYSNKITGINFRTNGIKARYKLSPIGDFYRTSNPTIRATLINGQFGVYSGGFSIIKREFIKSIIDKHRPSKVADAYYDVTESKIKQLVSSLTHKNAEERASMVNGLKKMWLNRETYLPLLIRMLKDPAVIVRMEALQNIRQIDAKEAVPDIIKMLDDPDAAMRGNAIGALTEYFFVESAIPQIALKLKDPDARVMAVAYIALASFTFDNEIQNIVRKLYTNLTNKDVEDQIKFGNYIERDISKLLGEKCPEKSEAEAEEKIKAINALVNFLNEYIIKYMGDKYPETIEDAKKNIMNIRSAWAGKLYRHFLIPIIMRDVWLTTGDPKVKHVYEDIFKKLAGKIKPWELYPDMKAS